MNNPSCAVAIAAMKFDGSEFAGYTPLSGNRYHGQHHCYMHTDCCTANGPRGFLCFLKAFSATLPVGSHHANPEGALPSTVFFCDYASAGNTWRRNDYYRTWFPVERGPDQ